MIWEKIIEAGILFLLVYTPFAYGGVSRYSSMLLQTVTGALLLVWLIKILVQRKQLPGNMLQKRHRVGSSDATTQQHTAITPKRRYYLRCTFTPSVIIICAFFGLVLFQLIPLPTTFTQYLSPQAYRLYAEAASLIRSPLPQRLPFSVCTRTTASELFLFLVYPTIFFLIINTVRTPRQIHRFVYIILIMGLLEALCGLTQLFSGIQLFVSHQGPFSVHGSFVNKNHFAGYLEMVILLGFGILFTGFDTPHQRSQKRENIPAHEQYAKAFFLLTILLIIICAHILSSSRGGFLSLAGGIFFFALLVSRRRLLRKWIMILLIFPSLLCILVVLIAPDQIASYLGKLRGQTFEISFLFRREIWRTQWHIFQDFPLIGARFGTFSHLAQRYQTFRWYVRLGYSESDFLQLLAETGIIGTTLMLWAGLAFFSQTVAHWKQRHSRWVVAIVAGGLSAIVSILIHGLIDFNLHIPSNALLLSVIAALTYVTVYTGQTRHHRHHENK